MRDDTRAVREAQIAEAAYAVIESKGFAGASMLAIARRARASNETLYNWYGDKLGLFRSLIERNTTDVRDLLEDAVETGASPMDALRRMAPVLLTMLLGERAIALNRAAAADPTGALGGALAEAGRGTVAPMIGALLDDARARGDIAFDDPDAALGAFLGLLIGDLQIRRATGALAPLSEAEIAVRADRALTQFGRLFSP